LPVFVSFKFIIIFFVNNYLFFIKVALLNNNAFVHCDVQNNARGQNCHKGVTRVCYDEICLKFASHNFLLYVVYMCQKSLNFTYAFKCYHKNVSWPHFSWPTLYMSSGYSYKVLPFHCRYCFRFFLVAAVIKVWRIDIMACSTVFRYSTSPTGPTFCCFLSCRWAIHCGQKVNHDWLINRSY